MTLLKNASVTKLSPNNAKITTTVKKVAPILKKPVDIENSPMKKSIAPSTFTKGKIASSPLKSSSVMEKSPSKVTPSKTTGVAPSTTIKKSMVASSSTCSPVGKAVSKPSVLRSPEKKSTEMKSCVVKLTPINSPLRKSEEVKKEISVRSVGKSSPVSKLKFKSVSVTNLKLTNNKPSATLVKSVSPMKSISSPKSSASRDTIKPLTLDKSKEIKTAKSIPGTLAKKNTSPAKMLKCSNIKIDNGVKTKPIVAKKAPALSSPKISKSFNLKATAKLPIIPVSTIANKVDELVTPDFVEKVDLCHCTGIVVDKCADKLDRDTMIDDCTTNNDFNVTQAFKVAEQLIRIQSTDSSLETIVECCENSTVNWDDVITLCPEPFDGISDVIKLNTPVELDEIPKLLNYDAPESGSEISSNADSFIESSEIISNRQQNDSVQVEDVTVDTSNESRNDDENIFIATVSSPEWTIVIDEFSSDVYKHENSIFINETCRGKENSSVIPHKTTYADSTSLTYADVLKKMPKILANSTNVQTPKNNAKLNFNLQVKEYNVLKKVEALYSTNIFFNKIEKNIEHVDYENDDPDEPEFTTTRKKCHKKMKHSPKRYMKNIYRGYDYDEEDHGDVFITRVWKNIY